MQRIVKILDTALTVNYNDRPISTQKDLDTYKFEFDDSWIGYVKTAVFYTDPMNVKHLLIPEDGIVTIPWEILTGKPQVLYVGVFGTMDTKIKPTTFGAVRLREGSYIDGVAPLPPTPDIYQQIIGAWEDAKADETERVADEIVRKQSETDRRATFDALVVEYNGLKAALQQQITDGTASVDALQVLEEDYAAKALALEINYAPRLTGVESQLAETDQRLDDISEKTNILAFAGQKNIRHKALYVGANYLYTGSSYLNSLFDDAFKCGLLIETISYEGFVNKADALKNEYDLLIVNTQYEIFPHQTVTSAEVVTAIGKFKTNGAKLLVFTGDSVFNVRKYNTDGTFVNASIASLIDGMSFTGIPYNFSTRAGVFRHGATYPFTDELLVSGAIPSNGHSYSLQSADGSTVFPVEAYDAAVGTAKIVGYKPNAYAVVMWAGATGTESQMACWRYLHLDVLINALLGKAKNTRLAEGYYKGKLVASFGVDCDVTNDLDAIKNLRIAIPETIPVEWGLVSTRVNLDVADYLRGMPGENTFVTHTKTHYSPDRRLTVTDEIHTIPSTCFIKLKHPYKVLITSVKSNDGLTTYVRKGGNTMRTASDTNKYVADVSTQGQSLDELQDGRLKFNLADVGKVIKVTYTYFDEYSEVMGSVKELEELGMLTHRSVYTTMGDNSISPNSYLYTRKNDVTICEYTGYPNLNRISLSLDKTHKTNTVPVGGLTAKYTSFLYMVDTEFFNFSKVDAKSKVIDTAVNFCVNNDIPICFYIHDFKISEISAGGIWLGTGNNADWKKSTFAETKDYIAEIYSYLFSKINSFDVVHIPRTEYAMRLNNINSHITYDVQGDVIKVQNKGEKTIKGLTFKIPLASAPSVVSLSNGDKVNYSYSGGIVTVWFDMLSGETVLTVKA